MKLREQIKEAFTRYYESDQDLTVNQLEKHIIGLLKDTTIIDLKNEGCIEEIKEVLERVIETLIDSGGSPFEYNSLDIQKLVNFVEQSEKINNCDHYWIDIHNGRKKLCTECEKEEWQ